MGDEGNYELQITNGMAGRNTGVLRWAQNDGERASVYGERLDFMASSGLTMQACGGFC